MPGYRSPVAISEAIGRELVHRFRLAAVVGAGAALATWILVGLFRLDGSPAFGDAALGGVAMLVVSLVTFSAPYLASPRELRALEAYHWVASDSARRHRATIGDGRIPATPRQAAAWLARHPDDTDASRGLRVFVHLVVGDVDAAERLVGGLPATTPFERFERDVSAAMVRLVAGGDPDLERIHAAAADLPEPDERSHGEVDGVLLEGLLAAGEARDWRPPFLAWRARRGVRAEWLLVRRMWIPIVGLLAVQALLVALAALLLRSLIP